MLYTDTRHSEVSEKGPTGIPLGCAGEGARVVVIGGDSRLCSVHENPARHSHATDAHKRRKAVIYGGHTSRADAVPEADVGDTEINIVKPVWQGWASHRLRACQELARPSHFCASNADGTDQNREAKGHSSL